MDIVQQLAAIVFVFALLGGAIVWLRRKNLILLGRPRTAIPAKQRLQVVDRVRLTPQHSVHVLRAGEREYIIAAHAGGCTLLASSAVEQSDAASAGGSQI